jgi:hypothetical protein
MKDVPLDAGANPYDGVVVTYYLPEQATGKVELAFLDSDGTVIRSFSSKPEGKVQAGAGSATETAEGEEGMSMPPSDEQENKEQGQVVPTAAGVNRFHWDMRYESAEVPEGSDLDPWDKPLGPKILPGSYTVRLTIGDQTLEQPLEVLKDPRLNVSEDDLKKQFDLLLKIRDRLSDTNRGINRVRRLRSQVEEWEKRTKDSEGSDAIKAAAKAINDELKAVEEQLTDLTAGKSPLMAPARLFEKLNALTEFVDSADGAPPAQAYEVFDDLSGKLDTQLARLQSAIDTQVAAFNKAVQDAQLPAVG